MSAGAIGPSQAAVIAEEFPFARERVYLNTAAEGLGSQTMERALHRYAATKRQGSAGRDELVATSTATKTHLARWLGCAAEDLAFFGSTSDAIGVVLRGLPWTAGDSLVITDLEFPSAMIGALALQRYLGIDVRLIRHANGWIDPEAIVERIDRSTRLVVLSHVSFHSGLRLDLDPIVAAAHDRGALVLVDASQSLGAIPVRTGAIDFLVACAFKWLLGSHGLAVLYASDRSHEPLPRHLPGWRGVSDFLAVMDRGAYTSHSGTARLESGMPPYPAIYALHDALQLHERLGPGWIAQRVEALAMRIHAICHERGLALLTPSDPAHRAGIVSFTHARAGELGRTLAGRGVDTWHRDGRVRLSAHMYVDDAQFDRLAIELQAALDAIERVNPSRVIPQVGSGNQPIPSCNPEPVGGEFR